MSAVKPIHVWNHTGGPNPKKVLIILEELGIPYEKEDVHDPKGEAFVKINPNGRLPAIQDPNHDDIIVWESGAIVEYIMDNYDTDKKLTPTSFADKWHAKQYLHFQMSGQGPYFGQAFWFMKYHPTDVPEAKKRYEDQLIRVVMVLDSILKGKQYLVGDKLSYADLCFVPWDVSAEKMLPEIWEKHDVAKKYPSFSAWHANLVSRPSVKKVYGA